MVHLLDALLSHMTPAAWAILADVIAVVIAWLILREAA